jgi:basic membrane protein A and related proteins
MNITSNMLFRRVSKIRAFAAVALACTTILAGFGSEAGAAETQTYKHLKVALVLPGQINDKGFNENGYHALTAIKEKYGAETYYSESTQMVNWERVIRGFADDGCDVILLHGLEFQDVAMKYAKEYPKTIFLVSAGYADNGTNCFALAVKSPQCAFLTGVLAGLQPGVEKASALVAFEYPLLVSQAEGFRYGFRCANPKSTSSLTVIGTFDDTLKAKEAALAQISSGAQVIWQLADTAGLGIIQAANEKNTWVIGWGIDQSPLAPNVVLTTQKVDLSYAMLDTVGDIAKGTFKPASRYYGVECPAAGIGPVNSKVTPEMLAVVEKWRQAIASGKVIIPTQIKMGESQTLPLLTLP